MDKKDKVWVVNINAFNEQMNTALYSFEELVELAKLEGNVDYRVVEEESATPVSEQLFHQLPLEMQTLSNDKVEEYIRNLHSQSFVCENMQNHVKHDL